MGKLLSVAMGIGLAVCIAGSQASAEVFAYPKKGQSQEQFEKDQFECHKWAKGQTGVDPTKPQQTAAAPPPQQGGAVRGAAIQRFSAPRNTAGTGLTSEAVTSGSVVLGKFPLDSFFFSL